MQQQGRSTVSPRAKYLKGSRRGKERRGEGGVGVGEEVGRVWNDNEEGE